MGFTADHVLLMITSYWEGYDLNFRKEKPSSLSCGSHGDYWHLNPCFKAVVNTQAHNKAFVIEAWCKKRWTFSPWDSSVDLSCVYKVLCFTWHSASSRDSSNFMLLCPWASGAQMFVVVCIARKFNKQMVWHGLRQTQLT